MVQDILLRWFTMELSMEICRYLLMPNDDEKLKKAMIIVMSTPFLIFSLCMH